MPKVQHKDITPTQGVHVVHDWVCVDDASLMTISPAPTEAEIGKWAMVQGNPARFFVLTSVDPLTWREFGSGATGASSYLAGSLPPPAAASDVHFISGKNSAGDGGEGFTIIDPTSTDTIDNAIVFSASPLPGRRKRVRSGREFNVLWYGARTDLTTASDPALITANTAAIQACVYACYAARGGRVVLPAGNYIINSTIHIAAPNGIGVVNMVFEGDAFETDPNSLSSMGTRIQTVHSDSPAVNVQGSRGVIIRNIGFFGPLHSWITTNHLASVVTPPLLDDTVASNWDDPSLSPIGIGRYTPSCAVCIEGWSVLPPSGPTYPTTFMPYGGYNCSDVMIEDCKIVGFHAAIVNKPSGDGQADFTVIRRVNINYCKHGISICNTQSRSVAIENVKMGGIYNAVTNSTHGEAIGKINGVIQNLSVGECIQAFLLGTSAYYGPLTVSCFYGEGLWRIGTSLANGSAETSLIFQSCLFSFGAQTDDRGVPASLLDGAASSHNVVFQGCVFSHNKSTHLIDQASPRIDGTLSLTERTVEAAPKPYLRQFHNGTCGGVILKNGRAGLGGHATKFAQYNIDSGVSVNSNIARDGMAASDRSYCIPYLVDRPGILSGARDQLFIPRREGVVAKSACTVTLTQDATKPGELSVTYSQINDWRAARDGWEPGDFLVDDATQSVFVIRSRTGTTVIAELQNNYKKVGGVYTCIAPFSTTTGNFYLTNTRLYTPKYATFGNTTSGSNVITNVGRADGFGAYIAGDIAVGDWLYIDDYVDGSISTANAKVTAVDGTARTITFLGNFTKTETGRRLGIFVRQPPANEASR